MAIKPIEEMIKPVSRKEETKMAMSDPDPMSERNDMMETFSQKYFGKALKDLTDDQIIELEENFNDLISKTRTRTRKPEGIMQLASASGNDKILSAMMWAATLPEFGSLEAVLNSLDAGETDINGLVNAYEDAIVDMN